VRAKNRPHYGKRILSRRMGFDAAVAVRNILWSRVVKAAPYPVHGKKPCSGFSANGVVLGTASDRGAVMAPHGVFDRQSDLRSICILCAKFHHAEIVEFFYIVGLYVANTRHSCRVLRQKKIYRKYLKIIMLRFLFKKHDIFVAKNASTACSAKHGLDNCLAGQGK
jgi:hypothetical protein